MPQHPASETLRMFASLLDRFQSATPAQRAALNGVVSALAAGDATATDEAMQKAREAHA